MLLHAMLVGLSYSNIVIYTLDTKAFISAQEINIEMSSHIFLLTGTMDKRKIINLNLNKTDCEKKTTTAK